MTTDKQKEQLRGYAQCANDMSGEIQRMQKSGGTTTLQDIALERLESRMRGMLVRLIEGQD